MVGEITCGGAWVSEMPQDLLPEEGTEAWELIQKDIQEGIIHDRRQELVWIGSDLNKEAIAKALDECLLKPDEENKDEGYEFPKGAKEDDVKAHGWKFGWKPKNEEENPIPEWPPEDMGEEEEEDMAEDEDEEEEEDEDKEVSK